jgi:hypothetical protein
MRVRYPLVALLILTSAGCRQKSDPAETIPVGADVQVTRRDGGVIEGTLSEKTGQTLRVDVGAATRNVPRSDIADVRIATPGRATDPPRSARFREVTLPATTRISVRLESSLSSETSRLEDPVGGVLVEPVQRDGTTLLPEGSDLRGAVTAVARAGKVKGRASLALRFDTIAAGGDVQHIDARFARTAAPGTAKDAKTVGIPAAGGAVIGAILGGKKGAAIGAAAGGGAGAAVVLDTPGKPIELPRGTVLSLELGEPLMVKVPVEKSRP